MSENVKIKINEYDRTSPSGRGIDSTDIAFIPGFSTKSDAPKYVPTLITNTHEFESIFGDTPYTLTATDVTSTYSTYGFTTGDFDRSYIYAKELLLQGLPVIYCNLETQTTNSSLDVFYDANSTAYSNLETVINDISDKSLYSVKYITSGGYPSVVKSIVVDETTDIPTVDSYEATGTLAIRLMDAAATRGDAVALIDYQFAPEDVVFDTNTTSGSVYARMNSLFGGAGTTYSSYGAAMYPWAKYTTIHGTITMPASFGYLMCVAKAIKSSPNWLAMAGVSRGLVPNIQDLCVPKNMISNKYAEEMQPKFGSTNQTLSINTITNIRPYGLTLWGNRTMLPVSSDGTTALNFLNTRNMLSDIKKLLYTTAKSCMFEQNSTDLWIKFKAGIEPLLRRLKAGNGISDYKIVRGTTKYDGNPLTKGEIAAVIKIYPMYAVEYFELAVEINDEDVTVS